VRNNFVNQKKIRVPKSDGVGKMTKMKLECSCWTSIVVRNKKRKIQENKKSDVIRKTILKKKK
jgi:hypothetical protein